MRDDNAPPPCSVTYEEPTRPPTRDLSLPRQLQMQMQLQQPPPPPPPSPRCLPSPAFIHDPFHPTHQPLNDNNDNDDDNVKDNDDTESRRQLKRQAMRLLKALGRMQTLETRLARCAVRHGDPDHIRATTQAELQQLQHYVRHDLGCPVAANRPEHPGRVGRTAAAAHWIESVYAALRQRWPSATTAAASPEKKKGPDALSQSSSRHERTRALLKSMTKGTQTRAMFDDPEALRGYTRQKFVPRAMLVVESLEKVQMAARVECEQSAASSSSLESFAPNANPAWFDLLQQKLSSIRTVCSIGCGPACEVVGLMAFLRTALSDNAPTQLEVARSDAPSADPVLERVILLDWAMEQWKPLILHDWCNVLVPQHVKSVVLDTCDVSHSLFDESHNGGAHAALLHPQSEEGHPQSEEGRESASSLDLIVVSYLLTETRNRWHPLLDDMLPLAQLALFLDPTAWQLHRVCQRYQHLMEFQWLDSSLEYPQLQSLEGRVGPAVLLGMRRRTT